MNRRLVLTVGLPRSGKTTWAREQIRKGIPVLEEDAVWVAAGWKPGMDVSDKDREQLGRALRTAVKILFISGHNTVIIVSCAVSRKDREAWVNDTGYWTRVFKVFDTSYEVCKERMIDEKLEDWMPHLNEMASKLEPIIEEEIRDGEGIIK